MCHAFDILEKILLILSGIPMDDDMSKVNFGSCVFLSAIVNGGNFSVHVSLFEGSCIVMISCNADLILDTFNRVRSCSKLVNESSNVKFTLTTCVIHEANFAENFSLLPAHVVDSTN